MKLLPKTGTAPDYPTLLQKLVATIGLLSGGCHYARDHSTLHTYRPWAASVQSPIEAAGGPKIAEIGTVPLKAIRVGGSSEDAVLLLTNVVNIPSAICNGVSPI